MPMNSSPNANASAKKSARSPHREHLHAVLSGQSYEHALQGDRAGVGEGRRERGDEHRPTPCPLCDPREIRARHTASTGMKSGTTKGLCKKGRTKAVAWGNSPSTRPMAAGKAKGFDLTDTALIRLAHPRPPRLRYHAGQLPGGRSGSTDPGRRPAAQAVALTRSARPAPLSTETIPPQPGAQIGEWRCKGPSAEPRPAPGTGISGLRSSSRT
jgi:hypothetical protein